MAVNSEKLKFYAGTQDVSALLSRPPKARAGYVLAHGAGAGMTHPFLTAVADGLAARGIATFRYQFPYMERKSGRTDPPKIAEAAVRAAVVEAGKHLKKLPLIAGGKSFGGRMTSQAEAAEHLPGVVGLAFLGFPLHAPGKPSDSRGDHLSAVTVPMLFLQGTRDDFADLALLEALVERLGTRATLKLVDDGDHSFHVRKASGRDDKAVMIELLDALVAWIDGVAVKGA
jgi:predicted alpha/beta-hydrolase family hydrolase